MLAPQWLLRVSLLSCSQLDRPGVLLQVRQLTERVLAVGAVVGFDPQVNAQVLGQVRGVGKRL